MHSSPAIPTGTGSSRSSTTYVRVFAIGRPIGGAFTSSPSCPGATGAAVATTVYSVGP